MKLFRRTKLNSKGFSHIEAAIAIVVIAGIAAVGVRVLTASHAQTINNLLISGSDPNGHSAILLSNGSQVGSALFSYTGAGYISNAVWVSNASAIDYLIDTSLYTANTSQFPVVPTNISATGFKYTTISYSEAASELAYTGCVTSTNSCGLYTSTAAGTSPKLIYTLPGASQWQSSGVSWSPDGKKIEATYNNVVNGTTIDYSVVVSSNGKTIADFPITYPAAAYCDSSGGNQWVTSSKLVCAGASAEGLVKINDNDTGVTNIPNIATNNSSFVGNYAVSPDGEKIVYSTQTSSYDSSVCKIYTVDISGKNNTLVYTGPGQLCTYLDWSPSSTSIVFGSDSFGASGSTGTGNVYTLNVPSTGSPVSIYSWTNGATPKSVDWSTQ